MAKHKSSQKQKKADGPTLAERADKYDLYQQSVQEPEHEVDFFTRAYKEAFGRKPESLREDFCGTFAVCCEWVKSSKKRTAIGVDLDPEPLDWGREHNLAKLTPAEQERVTLVEGDCREPSKTKAHVLAAQNFSFWIFRTRELVREYFEKARANLADDGIMVIDMMGGPECMEEGHEDLHKYGKGKKAFTYAWEQERYCPITHEARFHIHFRFKDKSALEPAFTYEWRFWTIPEVRELLAEAGFSESWVYWEGADEETGEGDGNWNRATTAESDPSWIAYIVAKR